MYCKNGYYVQRDYILLLCMLMEARIKHFTLLYCIIWQNYIIVYYNEFLFNKTLYTKLFCHTFIKAKHFYCPTIYFTSTYSTFLITQKANISIRLIEFITIDVLCYNTESCI